MTEEQDQHPLSEFIGRYIGNWTGNISLSRKDGKAVDHLINEWYILQGKIENPSHEDRIAKMQQTQKDLIVEIHKVYSRYYKFYLAAEKALKGQPPGNNSLLNKPPVSFLLAANDWKYFIDRVFKKGTAASFVSKLIDEAKELEDEMKNLVHDEEKELMEAADCILCLLASVHRRGYKFEDLIDAMYEKIEINRNREWVEIRPGVYQHINKKSNEKEQS
jgi:phosphoribosyl-ATP pyrophosphohydrolase